MTRMMVKACTPKPMTMAVRIRAWGTGSAKGPARAAASGGMRAGRPRIRRPRVKMSRLAAWLIRASPMTSLTMLRRISM